MVFFYVSTLTTMKKEVDYLKDESVRILNLLKSQDRSDIKTL